MIFHPYLNGELTPYADPMLCGSFTGIRANHSKGHFTRAVLEGVCYSLLDSKLTLNELGITLKTTESSASSLGSAMLAGLAMGVFESPKDAVEKCVKPRDVVVPNPENTEKYRKVFEEYKRIHDALAPIYDAR